MWYDCPWGDSLTELVSSIVRSSCYQENIGQQTDKSRVIRASQVLRYLPKMCELCYLMTRDLSAFQGMASRYMARHHKTGQCKA